MNTMPTHASLIFVAEDGIECRDLIDIIERVESVHRQGGLPLRIVGLDMTDHVLKIELAQ
jgi:hypothetical protein